MQVGNIKQFATIAGEDGERLTLRILDTPAVTDGGTLELSLECGDHYFRAILDGSEAEQLVDFIGFSYRTAETKLLVFSADNGERLTFRHSNMGEPYREGIDVRIEGAEDFPDYLGPFIESRGVREMCDFFNQ